MMEVNFLENLKVGSKVGAVFGPTVKGIEVP